MADKNLIATTVSSREKGIRRREEGETTSSQRMISIQGNQDECKKNHMKPEDESPTQRRNRKNDNDEEAERMEDMRSKGGGRLKHCRSSNQSKMKNCVTNKMASGRKELYPRSTEGKDKHSKNNEVTFIILQKT